MFLQREEEQFVFARIVAGPLIGEDMLAGTQA
jgi:hypothetical protein